MVVDRARQGTPILCDNISAWASTFFSGELAQITNYYAQQERN